MCNFDNLLCKYVNKAACTLAGNLFLQAPKLTAGCWLVEVSLLMSDIEKVLTSISARL